MQTNEHNMLLNYGVYNFQQEKVEKLENQNFTISRNSKIRLLRDNVVIHTGNLASLKRFKEEVKEVKNGFECGVMLENYSDIKIGDVIETFEEVKTERKLQNIIKWTIRCLHRDK